MEREKHTVQDRIDEFFALATALVETAKRIEKIKGF